MIIIPALDLLEGSVVRLRQGDLNQKTRFSTNPIETAKQWRDQGATRLHIVDLDGAFNGKPGNLEIIRGIVERIELPIQLGGGIRNLDTAKVYLDAGVERVILGTVAVENPKIVEEACRQWPNRIAVGIDARKGMVSVRGWTEDTSLTATELAKRFEGMGVASIIYTDIERDGTFEGVNVEATLALARSVSIPVIASGGVSKTADLRGLIEAASGELEGVIIGKALYAGGIDLKEAIALTRAVSC